MKKQILVLLLTFSVLLSMSTPVFADAADSQVQEILAGMTLEEKIGQMISPALRQWTDAEGNSADLTQINDEVAAAIRDYGFGSVILFASNVPGTAQTAALIADLQTAALESRNGLGLLVSVDQEGGYIYRLGTGTATCGNMALGAIGSVDAVSENASVIASELKAEGFSVNFAPVMDVNNNPANPIIGVRSFSDDPNKAAELGTAYIKALQELNITCALKHFPGHGDTQTDSHSGLPCINKTREELFSLELIPFQAGIDAGADMVMTAHIQYPQIEKETYTSVTTGEEIYLPATLSKTILTDILRGQMGFDGVICTDSMEMNAIAQHFDPMDAARLAINAGVDILLIPVSLTSVKNIEACGEYIDGIARMVRSGEISEKTINHAVERILTLKEKRGLLSLSVDKEAQVEKALHVVGSFSNHEKEWAIAERAVTLVKNEEMLPISDAEKVAVFVSYENKVNSVQYAMERLKAEGTIPDDLAFEVFCYEEQTEITDEMLRGITEADAVLASVESTGTAFMDPENASGWQAAFLDKLVPAVHDCDKKIAVISTKLPYDLARYQNADALLAVYNSKGMSVIPTQYDGETVSYGPNLPAAICAAFGEFAPKGKLPVNIYALDETYGFTDTVLYSRGFRTSAWNAVSFTDMPADSEFAGSIAWAVRKGIAEGVTDTTFRPEGTCTRGQMMTFLWRVAGCPEPRSAAGVFDDVAKGSYYEKAVLWGCENGYVKGVSGTRFAPDSIVTRGQCVTILARMNGVSEEAVGHTHPFTDVHAGDYYNNAVAWASTKGITSGTTATTFAPNSRCLRGQVVTFLCRCSAK